MTAREPEFQTTGEPNVLRNPLLIAAMLATAAIAVWGLVDT